MKPKKRTYKLVSDQVRAHCIDEIARAPLGKVVSCKTRQGRLRPMHDCTQC